jgi:hypothetical protein
MVLSIYLFDLILSEPSMPYSPGPPQEFFTVMMIVYAAIGLFFALVGALAVVGGIFALKKKRWGLALAGAIAGTITFFPCGIAAVILVSMGQPEFNRKPAGL